MLWFKIGLTVVYFLIILKLFKWGPLKTGQTTFKITTLLASFSSQIFYVNVVITKYVRLG